MAARRRKALLVGIDDYKDAPLTGCVADAKELGDKLEYNANDRNYWTTTLTSDDKTDELTRSGLRQELAEFFDQTDGFELLVYFAGHGAPTPWGVELVTLDYEAPYTYGVSLADLAHLANHSRAREVVLILDCCYSGQIADDPLSPTDFGRATLREEVTMMAAARKVEAAYSTVAGDHGAFTKVLLDGLDGPAAGPDGQVNAIGLFSFALPAFNSAFDQQPVLKCNAAFVPVLRTVRPPVDERVLQRLTALFQTATSQVQLTPDWAVAVANGEAPTDEQQAFRELSLLRTQGALVTPNDAELALVARDSASVRLSRLGQYWWDLVDRQLLGGPPVQAPP